MIFAVNYSPLLAILVEDGLLAIDRFKCPDWPDLLREAQKTLPVYVHFPLEVGTGQGWVLDGETHQPADLDRLEALIEETGTPYINTHFIAPASAYPEMPLHSRENRHLRQVVDGGLRDLEPLVRRFGVERVLVENIINERGWCSACALPEAVSLLIDESGCGFLFDLSHARLAAENLSIDPRVYINALPMENMRELHVTGIQALVGNLLDMILAIGDPYGMLANQSGKGIDHVSMTEPDWSDFAWVLDQIASEAWCVPWVISYEYGGVGSFWEQLTNRETYLNQVPRMAQMIHAARLRCSSV